MQWDTGTWNGVTDAIYNAAGFTGGWTAISAVLCIVALVVGCRHELEAYKKAERKK